MEITSKINSDTIVQRYSQEDIDLINSKQIQRSFGNPGDYVEFHLTTLDGNLIYSDYEFTKYKPSDLTNLNVDGTLKIFEINPAQNLIDLGYSYGEFNVVYNFFKKKIADITSPFFIKEISSDRTEIRVGNQNINNNDVETQVNGIIDEINNSVYYKDYLLNFGNNKLLVAVNIALDKTNTQQYEVLFKLYEPLPLNYVVKDTFWLVEEVIQSHVFNVDVIQTFDTPSVPQLRGPNFDIDLETTQNASLNYVNYSDLLATGSFSSSYQQVLNLIDNKGITINVDYTDFNDFIHFSSISERLYNFQYKLQLIELYQSQSYALQQISNTAYSDSNLTLVQEKINGVISKFDGYEHFLYFESSSLTWPKSNSNKPYSIYPTTASEATNWFASQSAVASNFDRENINNLEYTTPDYVREDDSNAPYLLFLNMVGQHFDNIWLYIKSTGDLYRNDNKINQGISKDLIADALRSLGIKIYNSQDNTNLFEYLIGSTEGGSYNFPTGSITTLVSASSETLPKQDLSKEILKRIYHNLPLLLKSKGTERGLKALITCFGIPNTILRVNEYGGYNKISSSLNYKADKFNYAFKGTVDVPWGPIFPSNDYPNSVEFRFKLTSSYNVPTQSLYEASSDFQVTFTSGSDGSGSVNLKVGALTTNNIVFNYYNEEWWNVVVNKESDLYTLFIGDKLGFYYSASVTNATPTYWSASSAATMTNSGSIFVQELRYWSQALTESVIHDHINNPASIVGNSITSSYYTLGFRLPLGTNLLTSSYSTHTNQNSSSYSASLTGTFYANNEFYYSSIPDDKVTEKIRIIANTVTSSILSPHIRLEEDPNESTQDLHYVDVTFSPTDEVNEDIVAQLGNFNIDNYIGDPKNYFSSSYASLDVLKKEYFQKYLRSYNYYDYIRLIKYFDNSLFRMIKDYVPARSNLSTGISISSPILERNKVKNVAPSASVEDTKFANYSGSGISEDQSYLYSKLSGSRVGFYNGELSGSGIDLYNKYFLPANFNPFSHPTASINEDSFYHNTFNTLLNNVSQSRVSISRKKIERQPYSTISITSSVELQDSYDSLTSHQLSRYDGVKLSSATFNTYTTASTLYAGDTSFGKTAAVDKNTHKIAWVNQVVERNLNFFDIAATNIKYLIDEEGSLTELSRHNYNLFEVQNIFKSGTPVIVSLSDPLSPTNQTSLDGTKIIFEGGFSYSPIIYREINETMIFDYLNPTYFVSQSLGFKAVSTSSVRFDAPGNADADLNNDGYWYLNNNPQATKFSFAKSSPTTWLYPSQIPFVTANPCLQYGGASVNVPAESATNWFTLDRILPFSTAGGDGGYASTDFTASVNRIENGSDNYIGFTAPRQSVYTINLSLPFTFEANNSDAGWSSFKLFGVLEKKIGTNWTYVTHTKFNISYIPYSNVKVNPVNSFVWFDNRTQDDPTPLKLICTLDNYVISLNQNDQVRVKYYFMNFGNMFIRASDIVINFPTILSGSQQYFEAYDNVTSNIIPITQGQITSAPPIFALEDDLRTITFSDTASLLYNNTIFTISGSSIDDYYSPINYNFHFEVGDLIRFGSFYQSTPSYYYITSVLDPVITISGSNPYVVTPLQVVVDRPINPAEFTTLKFAVLRRIPDETSVLLKFNKFPGATSKALLIPYDIRPDMKNKIADIVAPLKASLNQQALVDRINGGEL